MHRNQTAEAGGTASTIHTTAPTAHTAAQEADRLLTAVESGYATDADVAALHEMMHRNQTAEAGGIASTIHTTAPTAHTIETNELLTAVESGYATDADVAALHDVMHRHQRAEAGGTASTAHTTAPSTVGENIGAAAKCHGWDGTYYADGSLLAGSSQLFSVAVGLKGTCQQPLGHGNFSLRYLWDAGILSAQYPQFTTLADFMTNEPDAAYAKFRECEENAKQPRSSKQPLYYATGSSLKATECSGHAISGHSGMCRACYQVQFEESVHKRARAAHALQQQKSLQTQLPPGHQVNPELCLKEMKVNRGNQTAEAKEAMLHYYSAGKRVDGYAIMNLKRTVKHYKQKLADALGASVKAVSDCNYPELIRNLIDAHELSKLEIDKEGSLLTKPLNDILTGISKCLLHGTRRGRTLTENEQLFHAALLNVKGPWSQKLVSSVLLGPDVDTSKKYRAKLCEGFSAHDWRGNVKAVKECMQSYGDRFPDLHKAPGLVSEDASTILRRIDLERLCKSSDFERLEIPAGGLAVQVWGLDGGERVVKSVDELRALLKSCSADDIATYVYIWLWIPQVEHAPWFPLRCEITNNKFDRFQIFNWWRELDVEFEANDLLTIGNVSDGDARLRAADFFLMRELGNGKGAGDWLERRHSGIDHVLLNFLKIGITKEGHWKLGFQDYMHLLWRWRRHLLDPKRQMHVGPGFVVNWRHLEGCPHLRGGDLRYSDKQNWNGTERIFSLDTVLWLQEQMDENPEEHNYKGTLSFVWLGYQLRVCWLGDSDPLLAMQQAVSVLTSPLYWRFWLDKRPKQPTAGCTETYSITRNFMARETFLATRACSCFRNTVTMKSSESGSQ